MMQDLSSATNAAVPQAAHAAQATQAAQAAHATPHSAAAATDSVLPAGTGTTKSLALTSSDAQVAPLCGEEPSEASDSKGAAQPSDVPATVADTGLAITAAQPQSNGSVDGGRPSRKDERLRMPQYISRRKINGVLMFVRRIPEDIRALGLYAQKTSLVRLSLSTTNLQEALPRARQLTAAIDRMWADARQQALETAGPNGTPNPRELRTDDIPVLQKRLVSLLLHTDELDRQQLKGASKEGIRSYIGDVEQQRAELREANMCADADVLSEEAAGFLQAEGLQCAPESTAWSAWLQATLSAHLVALQAIATRLDGQVVATPAPPPPVRSDTDLDDLQRALEHWKSKASPEPKTVSEMQAVLHRFTATTGRTRISAIQPDDVLQFLSVERTRTSARGGPVNPQTVNKGLALLKALFSVVHTDALKNYGIANPLADVRKFRVKARDRARRKTFTEAQLVTLFSGPVHATHARPEGGAGEWVPPVRGNRSRQQTATPDASQE